MNFEGQMRLLRKATGAPIPMPRYFFHRADGSIDRDDEGTELAGIEEARSQAVAFAAESLQENPQIIWTGQDLRVEVVNEAGLVLFTVITIGIVSPATETSKFSALSQSYHS